MADCGWQSATALAALVFALDRLTKWIIETRVSFFDTHTVIPGFFDIVHSQNRGAAFGMFADSTPRGGPRCSSSASLARAGAGRRDAVERRSGSTAHSLWGLSLISAARAGNVFDRIVCGAVTDFLVFYIGDCQWPAFNVAD